MASVEFGGKTFEVDEDGFLLKGMEEWSNEWVDYVKKLEGIETMGDDHWKVIQLLQEKRHCPDGTNFVQDHRLSLEKNL